MRNNFIYSGNVEFQRPGIDKLSEGIFNSAVVVEEDLLLQEVQVKMLKKVVIDWREIWRVWCVRQSFVA